MSNNRRTPYLWLLQASVRSALGLAITCAVVIACSSTGNTVTTPLPLPSCAAGTSLFTVSPVALTDIGGWVPLGATNPPAHTLPTDHQYIYLATFGSPSLQHPVNLSAPGDITVTGAKRTTYAYDGHSDYSLIFSRCREVFGEFGHVGTVTPSLLAALGNFDQNCQTYSPAPSVSVTSCYTGEVAVPVAAGASLGTVGGPPNPASMDFSLWDTRIAPHQFANPARWQTNSSGQDIYHIVPASDYYAEPARSAIAAKVGRYDGQVQRTVLPVGGTIALDLPGTIQGTWFNNTQPTNPEGPHLAIIPYIVDPTQLTISMGLSQPNLAASEYRLVHASTGLINRHPAQVTSDGQIYCYELQFGTGALLLRLIDATTLRVEARPIGSTCASIQPWAFNAGSYFDYRR